MIQFLRSIVVFFSIIFLLYLSYLGFVKDQAEPWTTFAEPTLASFTSLEQDADILDELKQQTEYNSYKPIYSDLFTKPTIFSTY